jgi:hypothetical protein
MAARWVGVGILIVVLAIVGAFVAGGVMYLTRFCVA